MYITKYMYKCKKYILGFTINKFRSLFLYELKNAEHFHLGRIGC